MDQASNYAGERQVFGRPIGRNRGIQFPIARSFVNAEAAKLLAADASWEAANACIQTFGGFGFAQEDDVERKFRETRLYQVAPVSTNLILSHVAEHVLGMPRSF